MLFETLLELNTRKGAVHLIWSQVSFAPLLLDIKTLTEKSWFSFLFIVKLFCRYKLCMAIDLASTKLAITKFLPGFFHHQNKEGGERLELRMEIYNKVIGVIRVFAI